MPLCEIRTMHIQQMHNSLELSSKYQHCIHAILSNMFEIAVQNDFDQLISTLSPNGILLNSSQLNPLLPITETTYIDLCDAFADSSLLIGFFGWLLWRFHWFQLAYWAISVDCFGVFADSSLPIGLFVWLLWRFRWFQLAYWLLWLTALALSLIPACLSVFFGWLLWHFRWF